MSETADTHAPRRLPWHHRAPVLTTALNIALILTIFLTRERWESWVWDYDLPAGVDWKECRNGRLIGFCDDSRALLIDIATGEEVASYKGMGRGWRTEFSPDGSLLLLYPKPESPQPRESTIVVDVATGRVVRDLGAETELGDLAFSPDSDRLFICRRFEGSAILHLKSPERDMRFSPPVSAPRMARFSPDGKMLVAVLGGERVFLLDAATGKRVHALRCDEQIKLAEDDPGPWLGASGWDYGDFVFQGRRVYLANFFGDGRYVATAREDGLNPDTAYVFAVATGREVSRMQGYDFRAAQGGSLLAAWSHDTNKLEVHEPETGCLAMVLPFVEDDTSARRLRLLADGRYAVSTAPDEYDPENAFHVTQVVQLPAGRTVFRFVSDHAMTCFLSPDLTRAFSVEHALRWPVVVRRLDTGERLATISTYVDRCKPLGNMRLLIWPTQLSMEPKPACVYRRIRPEQWWGVFWLPHLYLIIALALAVAWSGWRDVKRLRQMQ